MTRGRPRLPEGERLVHVSLRLPQWLVDWYSEQGNRSALMRRALEKEATNAYPHLTAINAELVACLEAMTEFAEGVIRIKRLTDTNGIVAASRAALARAKENSQ